MARFYPVISFITEDFISCGFVINGVKIGALKMIPVVFLLGVFLSSSGEVESEPGFDLVGGGDAFGLFVWVDFAGVAFFSVVGGCFVV